MTMITGVSYGQDEMTHMESVLATFDAQAIEYEGSFSIALHDTETDEPMDGHLIRLEDRDAGMLYNTCRTSKNDVCTWDNLQFQKVYYIVVEGATLDPLSMIAAGHGGQDTLGVYITEEYTQKIFISDENYLYFARKDDPTKPRFPTPEALIDPISNEIAETIIAAAEDATKTADFAKIPSPEVEVIQLNEQSTAEPSPTEEIDPIEQEETDDGLSSMLFPVVIGIGVFGAGFYILDPFNWFSNFSKA